MKIIKTIQLAGLIYLIIFMLTACGNQQGNKDYKLLYWCSNNTQEIEFADYIVNEWNKLNPNYKIKYQPVPEGRSSEEVILAAVVGKTTPDIYSNMWQGDVEAYAQAGVLVPFNDKFGFQNYITDRCSEETIKEITSLDGNIYQIPWKINPIMMIYNKNHLKDIGYDLPPKNFSQFFDAAKKFQIDSDGDGYFDRWFGYSEVKVDWWQRFFDFYPLYLSASGGAPLVKDNKAAFRNKYAVEVFTFLRELYKNKYFPQERLSARQDAFLYGTIATRFTGPWEITHAEKYKPEGFEYDFAPMPVPDNLNEAGYTYGDPKNFVVFNTCKHPQIAVDFLMFATSKMNDYKFLSITKQFPRRKDLLTDSLFSDYFDNNEMMKRFAEQANKVRGTDACADLKEVFDLISQQYEACVVYGVKTPEQAVEDAADAVDLLFIK